MLQLSILFIPNSPSHYVLSVPILALKSQRMMVLSALNTIAVVDLRSS